MRLSVLLIALFSASTFMLFGQMEDADIPLLSASELQSADKASKPYAPSLLLNFRDVFGNAAQWNLGGESFYNRRGLDRVFNNVYFLGMPMRDLENGMIDFNVWAGLNHVVNNKGYRTNGLMHSTFGFTGLGAGTTIDPRPHTQYDGFQVSYSQANRNYTNRLMMTYNTGYFKKGWNVSLSASKRYAQTGYVEGTPYDSYSYYAAVEKRFGLRHSLTLTGLGSWLKRGKLAPTTKEMYELAGTNLYNPNWGMQEGVMRNAKMVRKHQPMVALTHDWNISKKTNLITSASFLFGKFGSTSLDWYDFGDPRPDYYRKLPTFYDIPQVTSNTSDAQLALIQGMQADSTRLASLLSESDTYRQLDWYRFYGANTDPENADSYDNVYIDGVLSSITGNRANILVTEFREDSKKANISATVNTNVASFLTISGGAHGVFQNKHFFQVADDLLGADYHLNYNQFAERDATPDNIDTVRQHDLDNPDRVIYEGDRYGYDYNAVVNFEEAWGGLNFTFRHFDVFASGTVSHTGFYRNGNNRNGLFPENSKGKSEVQNFINYGGKLGLTYKINGRNYIIANGIYETKAPLFENAFVSNRTRNQVASNLKSEVHFGGEAGYILRANWLEINAVGYYFQVNDVTDQISFYNDRERAFTNYTITDIDREHMGIEIGVKNRVTDWFNITNVFALGQHIFTNRPTAITTVDNSAEILREELVYQKNFHVPNSAELAYTGSLNFNRGPFFSSISFNFTDRQWISHNPVRRTFNAVSGITDDEVFQGVIEQERYDSQFSMDFFGGYTWNLRNTFKGMKQRSALVFNLGISNLTNNREFIAIGFENNRFDFEGKDINRFQNRYFYGNGINYFMNITYRL